MTAAAKGGASLAAALLALVLVSCGGREEEPPPPPPEAREGTIVALGDSLTAGLGVSPEEAYPAVLERRLASAGYGFRVVNAGVSGETSSGARSRVAWIMRLGPDIVILETGANDGLRGIDPALVRENVAATARAFGERGVTVVLAGMRMVRNMGAEYNAAFEGIYPEVARELDLVLIPFFLEGVAGDPRLNQADGIHPTAEGYRVVAETVLPAVEEAIRRRRAVRPTSPSAAR